MQPAGSFSRHHINDNASGIQRHAVPASHSRCHVPQDPEDPLLPQSDNFDDFINELKTSVDKHMLPKRAIRYVFDEDSPIPPACGGDW